MIDTKALRAIAENTPESEWANRFGDTQAIALLDELDRLRAALGEALDIAQAQGCLHPDESDRVDALRAVQRGDK